MRARSVPLPGHSATTRLSIRTATWPDATSARSRALSLPRTALVSMTSPTPSSGARTQRRHSRQQTTGSVVIIPDSKRGFPRREKRRFLQFHCSHLLYISEPVSSLVYFRGTAAAVGILSFTSFPSCSSSIVFWVIVWFVQPFLFFDQCARSYKSCHTYPIFIIDVYFKSSINWEPRPVLFIRFFQTTASGFVTFSQPFRSHFGNKQISN